jgi:hypothetical protein
MQIYQSEWDDGVAEQISANASVAYISEAQLCTKKDINISKDPEDISDTLKSLAALNDADLYYVQSILVSSSWNKNDDVFDKAEVWKAKSTPEDKPTNLEHDEDQIVGHIVSNWPVDTKGNIIPDNTSVEDLPEKFHILTGSVIYRNFTSPELRDRANALIDQIKDGTKYVSMECYFDNFDYGLTNKVNGEYKVLERNNNTAYLTKHLRAYGGLGEYEDYKIGRVLRNINFSGKGFVDKPANPESVIFDSNTIKNMLVIEEDKKEEKEKIVNFSNNSVSNIQATSNPETDNMSLEKDVESLKDKVEAMDGCGDVLKDAYSRVSELEAKVMDLEATMIKDHDEMKKKEDELKAELEAAQTSISSQEEHLEEYKQKMQAEIEESAATKASETEASEAAHTEVVQAKDAEIETLKSELSTANEAIEAYKAKEVELARQAKIMSRVSELVESGVKTDVAEATVAKFETLDDESFATIKSLVSSDMPEWIKETSTEEEAVAEETEAEAETEEVVEEAVQAEEAEEADESPEAVEAASTETLEDVEVEEEVSLSVGSEDDSELQTARASLVEFVQSRLGKNQN